MMNDAGEFAVMYYEWLLDPELWLTYQVLVLKPLSDQPMYVKISLFFRYDFVLVCFIKQIPFKLFPYSHP